MIRTRTIVVISLLAVAAAVAFGLSRFAAIVDGTFSGGPRSVEASLATGRPTMYEFSTDT